jgi:hypothetical protein
MRNVLRGSLCAIVAMSASVDASELANNIESSFVQPPDSARPWVYWFWLNGNITREGISADLEAMKRAGIGGVLIMEVDQGAPQGPVDFMGQPWRDLFKFVVSEAERLGLEVNMNNDAGWNGSGGPWIKPEESMQKVVWIETDVEGPRHFADALKQPDAVAGYYRDISVLAFPAGGPYRIADIDQKACYRVGFVNPSIPSETRKEDAIDPSRLVDISSKMDANGRLDWDAPAGTWTVMRIGHTSTGVENAPAPSTGRGLECDKLSKEGIEANFNGMMAKLIADVGPAAGKVLVATHIDSWENGAQNWTERMREEFQARRGYDPLPYLPALSGRVVGDLKLSERFLWDLRQTISDLTVENYAGHLRTLANQHGVRLSIEAYGGPCDDLRYAAQADEPMGEFWMGGNALEVCRFMASAAHTSGKQILGAEAFTADNHERWLMHPATIKSLGDRAFCLGVNRFVVHRYAMQPWQDRRPGMTMGPWGLHYERTQTWWNMSPAWHLYLSRCQFMLRQGLFVADICYLQPEAAPQGAREHHRNGYDYDDCSAETVLTRMAVRDGRIVLPDGMSYGVLALPDVPTMTPPLLQKIRGLIDAGATVIGPRPQESPSLTDYPKCDEEVKRIAQEVWGDCDGQTVKARAFGKGRILWGTTPEDALAAAGVKVDFSSNARLDYIHRVAGTDEMYFVANPRSEAVSAACTFRQSGKQPELWSPETGAIGPAAVSAEKDGATTVVLNLGPSGSVFVVFRQATASADSIASVTRDGKTVLSAVDTAPAIAIKNAKYGVLDDPRRTRDVRGKVQELVAGGAYSFAVARLAAGDDPAPDTKKEVTIEYSIGDRAFTVSGNDEDTVHLTGDTVRIEVTKAMYGVLNDPQRTRDVRKQLQRLLDTGEMSFPVARLAQGDDPAPGIVKTLALEYRVDGIDKSASGTDSDRLVLYEPPADSHVADVKTNAEHRDVLEVWENGRYETRATSGKSMQFEVQNLPPPSDVTGPWELRFDPKWGAPDHVTMEKLVSWSEHSDPGIRYYSGPATYTKTFNAPGEWFGKTRRLYLDLGVVQVMANLTLNGKALGTLWKAPYRVDVTDTLKAGENTLAIDVVNLWVNRLIGDEQLPEDSARNDDGTLKEWPQWLTENKPGPAGRYTFTSWRLWKKDEPLQESGLVGPVTIRSTEVFDLEAK